MSEVRLNIIDRERAVSGTCHGSVADAVVAALSAEPETVGELEAALGRFIRPVDAGSPLASFRVGENAEVWDAGIVIVDLVARVVAAESTYSVPQKEGEVVYHDGARATEVGVLYRVPADWLFVGSVNEYEAARERRRKEREANPPPDARAVLYGRALIEFIVNECLAARNVVAGSGEAKAAGEEGAIEEVEAAVAAVHARWLMVPREDLRGASPREVLLAKREFIDFDLHARELQWTFVGEGPPCLSRDSFAYRFGGCGTHECVVYYDLLRHLLWSCWKRVSRQKTVVGEDEAARLEKVKTNWLEQPQRDYDGRIPALIVENERRRLPLAMSAKQMVVDEDCPVCQMMGEEMGPGFWHLDGSGMDDDFPFSFHLTREEWEEERRRREKFNEEFEREWAERGRPLADESPSSDDETDGLIQ